MKDNAVRDQTSLMERSPCPNCGFAASGHYCSNCGQQTHLHKDTFWGLISHFIAHYFHYDSKFWRTLSALVLSPGKLTLAYLQKKRQSYIPPISLYIFVSIVFFLLLPMFQQSFININDTRPAAVQADTVGQLSVKRLVQEEADKQGKQLNAAENYVTNAGDVIFSAMKENPKEFKERLLHSFPKIFFFMIPVLAALLKLFLIRQKKYYFVDHAVFALHTHSFIFIVCLIPLINPFSSIQDSLSNITLMACLVYFIVAMHRVYKSGWIKSVIIGLATTALYFIILLLAGVVDIWLISVLK